MKRLVILCIIVGIFAYYYKDGQIAASNIKSAVTQITDNIKGMF